MQSRIGWWIAAGLLTLSVGCDKLPAVGGLVDAVTNTLDANHDGDQECQNYLAGIKNAQIAYDAAFDTYVECSPWPDEEPGKELRTWEDGSAFDTLGWHPDADVLGSYSVEVDDHAALDFTARCVHDADGDGELTVWEISREESAKRVGDDSEPDSAEAAEPAQASTAENPLPYCLSEDAARLSVAREDVPGAAATLSDVSDRELLVGLTQAQLCNEDVQKALMKRRRHVAIAIAPSALNGQALGDCLEAVSSKVCGVILPAAAGNDVLGALGALDDLTDLLAARSQITDSGLAFLSGADSLRHLDLRDTSIGDDGLAYLAGLTALEVLKLEGTKVTGHGRAHLTGIEGLQSEADESDDDAADEDDTAADEDEDGADEDTEGGFLSALFSKLAAVFSSESDADNDEEDDDTGLASAPAKNPDADEGAMAKREEGKVGKRAAQMPKAKDYKVQKDKETAEIARVLGALADGSELDGVIGASGLNSPIAGGIGAKTPQIGAGGLGSRGSGIGRGGRAAPHRPAPDAASSRSGYGEGSGKFGAKTQGAIAAIGGDPIILGALDKSLIDAVIRRTMSQIRYCYQRELLKDPSIGGKLVVKFVVSPRGTVSSATTKSSTLGSRTVESCINGRFLRLKFPEPKGGGIVIVSYPFIFAPG